MEYILVFESHNQAILLFNKLIKLGFKVELVTTPCDISAGCSQSLKFKEKDMHLINSEARRNSIRINGIYLVKKNGKTTEYTKIKMGWAISSFYFLFKIK